MFVDAYAAGLIDGEAHVFVRSVKNAYGNLVWRGAIAIAMTDETAVRWMHEQFGGSVCMLTKRVEHHKQQWRWTVAGRKAYAAAKRVEPFAIVKKEPLRQIVDHCESGEKPVINRKSTRGELNHGAKLTWQQVHEIRAAAQIGKRYGRAKKLAQQYGVEKSTIHLILRNKIWIESCSQLHIAAL